MILYNDENGEQRFGKAAGMVLAVDIGNSTMTIGLYEMSGTMRFRGALKTDKNRTRDQIAIDLLDIFRLYRADMDAVTGTIISSVVPPVTAATAEAVQLLTGREPMIVGPGIRTGMNILAEIHNQLGADIVACSVGALKKYPAPIIVINMDTATTLSYLGENTYVGGVIIPGLRIAAEALSNQAARLPDISLEHPSAVLGRSTIESMRSGILYGNAGMIDSMLTRMEEEAGNAASVVITGINSGFIRDLCRREMIYDENLLMDGLFHLHQKNIERRRKDNRKSGR